MSPVGFFGYTGKEVISEYLPDPYTSEIKMYGPDMAIDIGGKLMINMQYVWRTDSDVYDLAAEEMMTDMTTRGGFARSYLCRKRRYEQMVHGRTCQPCRFTDR